MAQVDTVSKSKQAIVSSKLAELLIAMNVYDIKMKFKDNSTSTYLDDKNSTHFIKPFKGGYIGQYMLIDSRGNVVGQLTVYNNKETWLFNNTNDVAIEIKAWDSCVELPYKIGVGSYRDEVISYLGKPTYETRDTLLYHDNTTAALFILSKNAVSYLCVGNYDKSFAENARHDLKPFLEY